MSLTKQVVEVPAEYVDTANDSLKWLVILMVALAYNTYMQAPFGVAGVGTPYNLRMTLVTAGLTALGLFIYHFVVSRLFVFMPKAGQSTYYWALKRN